MLERAVGCGFEGAHDLTDSTVCVCEGIVGGGAAAPACSLLLFSTANIVSLIFASTGRFCLLSLEIEFGANFFNEDVLVNFE